MTSTHRGRTTPDSTTGSFRPHSGSRSRVNVEPAGIPLDVDAAMRSYEKRMALHAVRDKLENFSQTKQEWENAHPGWTVAGCTIAIDDGRERIELAVEAPASIVYELSRSTDYGDRIIFRDGVITTDDTPAALNGQGQHLDAFGLHELAAAVHDQHGPAAFAELAAAITASRPPDDYEQQWLHSLQHDPAD